MSARLVRKAPLSDEVCAFTFAALEGSFSGCAAGAHVAVHLPGGMVRSYSLTEWDPQGTQVGIAVKVDSRF
ncbi:hypothetical protein [Streptomyces sp. NPDC048277]|uniref:hypothetical protein n=1 Tax=Streptomyces sp. NPDC048277 TaxID=3155027 RepID=UPI0033F2293D